MAIGFGNDNFTLISLAVNDAGYGETLNVGNFSTSDMAELALKELNAYHKEQNSSRINYILPPKGYITVNVR